MSSSASYLRRLRLLTFLISQKSKYSPGQRLGKNPVCRRLTKTTMAQPYHTRASARHGQWASPGVMTGIVQIPAKAKHVAACNKPTKRYHIGSTCILVLPVCFWHAFLPAFPKNRDKSPTHPGCPVSYRLTKQTMVQPYHTRASALTDSGPAPAS